MLQDYLGPSRAVLISRHLSGADSQVVLPVPIPGLPPKYSSDLLRGEAEFRAGKGIKTSLLSASGDDLHELWRVTGGAPLALHLVVGQSSYLSVGRIVANLEKAKGPATGVYAFIFRQDWGELARAESGLIAQHVLGFLCDETRPEPVSRGELLEVLSEAHVLSVADPELWESQVDSALSLLVTLSLVHPFLDDTAAEFCYEVHPLTRNFIRSGLGASWRKQRQILRQVGGRVQLKRLLATERARWQKS